MAKIETVKQHDLKDCGACSLLSIIKYYEGYVPLEKIREDTATGINGTTAFHIIKAANGYGFEAMGVKVKNIFDKNIYLPAIAHLILKNGLQHFAVIYRISKNYVWLMDPAKGKIKMKMEEFTSIWDNVLILFTPTNGVITFQKELTITTIFLNLLKTDKTLLITICIVNAFLMIFAILGNFYFQIAISCIQNGTDINFLKFVVVLFFNIFLFKVLTGFLKNYYLNYLNKNLDTKIFTEFLSHIFNLPLKFMQNRTTGEITSRISELSEVKNLLAEIFVNVLLNSILILGAIVVLYLINSKLFLILCLVVTIYMIMGLIFNKLLYQKIKDNIETTTEFNSVLVENVEMNTSIKNLNLVKEFLYTLENKLVLMLKSNFKLQSLMNNIELFKSFIYEIGLFLITTFGIYLIYQGKMELISLVTFNSLILYLFEPVKGMLDLVPKYNYLKASFNKLSEFINIASEVEEQDSLKNIDNASLSLKNVEYSYNKFSNIIENVNMDINAGDKILLLGKSGSGKSTICKLICRALSDYKGEISINFVSEKDYNLKAIRENVLYVSQNEKLFTGTIKENIVCFRNVQDSNFARVAKICRLEEIVRKRPNRYNSVINASMNNLSGGERQRIILARGLLKQAKIIILDEALSEVNETLERDILKDIFENFKEQTLIYVTHKQVSDLFSKVIDVGDNNVRNI